MQVQVQKAMDSIYETYKNEIGSLTVCGHSLVSIHDTSFTSGFLEQPITLPLSILSGTLTLFSRTW